MCSLLSTWRSFRRAGIPVSIGRLVSMQCRHTLTRATVEAILTSYQHGLDVPLDTIEAHHLAGGKVDLVVSALAAARAKNVPVELPHLCAIDLSGGQPHLLAVEYLAAAGEEPELTYASYVEQIMTRRRNLAEQETGKDSGEPELIS